jgi:hypothetical protein
MTRSTDEIMEWQGREQSSIEPYCTGYLWVLDGEPLPHPNSDWPRTSEQKRSCNSGLVRARRVRWLRSDEGRKASGITAYVEKRRSQKHSAATALPNRIAQQ